MARAATAAVFALAALATLAEAAVALGNLVMGSAGASWAIVLYAVLKAAVVSSFAVLVALRPRARRTSRDPMAFIACAAALCGAAGLHPPASASMGAAQAAGLAMALAGTAWMLASVLALGTCFGILPEARGMVTRGPYRLVRHPLYLGEITACVGLIVASPSLANVLLGALFAIGQAIRMRLEEAELEATFPDYAGYSASTPRLLPWPRPRLLAASGDRLEANPESV